MIIDSSNQVEVIRAEQRFKWLVEHKKTFELKEKRTKRTYSQNNYLHLLLSYFGLELGYTLAESKQMYKGLNKDVFIYQKNGQQFIRSSADLDTKEMTITIDRFKNFASVEAGVYLPEASDVIYLNYIESEINKTTNKIRL